MENRKAQAGRFILLILLALLMIAALVFYFTHHSEAGTLDKASNVILNEVMSSNKGAVPDEYGDYPDYVELYNASGETVDISGYGLSDDLLAGAKYVFPQGTSLKSGEFFIVYCAGEEKDDHHASFKLSSTDELVLYQTSGNAIESMALQSVTSGNSFSRLQDGIWADMAPSPGYPNTVEGAQAYAESLRNGEDIG